MTEDKGQKEGQHRTELGGEERKGTHLTPLIDNQNAEPVSPAAITANAEQTDSGEGSGGSQKEA